ncbi:SDR family NAD(P)-dependent oxidoreductase [Nonomuraea sp. KM88]|uniref:SDR family NAD(P)-dependent oxidoreductase n=1 Tax=Nonomuraea sp. KM88 TaxID=3457427 RepID=UPI003FCD8083
MTVPEEGLRGLRVLVTGASRGLGAATARRFAEAGANVLTASRSVPPEGSPGIFIRADLASAQGVAELAQRVIDAVGGVDVLVNNAGATTGAIPTLERSDEAWRSDLDMNLLSAVRLDRALVPGMAERGSEHLQRIADSQGTGLEELKQRIVDHLDVPMGRPGEPEDVAEMIAFLASPGRSGSPAPSSGWTEESSRRCDRPPPGRPLPKAIRQMPYSCRQTGGSLW